MSKVSFRARALDASKQMPVFVADELPDLGEYAAINRAVAQMPTGMEKEEEMVRFSLSKMAAVVFRARASPLGGATVVGFRRRRRAKVERGRQGGVLVE